MLRSRRPTTSDRLEAIEDLVAALQGARPRPSGWIVGRGYDDTLLAERRHPTRLDLDRVSKSTPIWIVHTSGHLGVANTAALKIAEVTRDTPQPPGAVIRRDAAGEPNGVFEECGSLVSRHIPGLTADQRLEAIEWSVNDYVEDGVTTSVIAHGNKTSLGDLQRGRSMDLLPLRIISMVSRSSPNAMTAAEAGGIRSGFGDHWLKIGAVKMGQDGSNQGFTGYFTEPYHTPYRGDATYRGYPRRTREALTTMVKQVHRAGYQIAIHGNGDAAIDDILYAFAEAQKDWPRDDARHRIEHCQYVREDQLDRIAKMGITPSFFVGHVFYWGDRHRDVFLGPRRAAHISPLHSAARRGIRFTIHDDTPVTPVNPLQLVWGSVNRLTRSGRVLGPDQRISVIQAIRAVTLDAAWQNFEEKSKGSIEVGKLADMVVLSDDPRTVARTEINKIRVLQTIVDGRLVYRR